jgi:DnaK suppressor protein
MEEAITQIKAQLEQERGITAERLGRIEGRRRRTDGALSPDFAESAQQQENDEVLDGLSDVEGEKLASIEAALLRIDAGTYGRCAACGDKIKPARLVAAPFSTLCIGCAQEAER